MRIELIHNTPLWVASRAIRKCWASEDKSDTVNTDNVIGSKDRELIHRVGNKNKHSSTLEHLNYSFDIRGISRACLQEVARHRIASYSVKSTRYTLKELKQIDKLEYYQHFNKFLVPTADNEIDNCSWKALKNLKKMLDKGIANDVAKYCLPEAYRTEMVMTINARSLQNFLSLRTSKAALLEIQLLAKGMYYAVPEEHKYLFKEVMDNEDTSDI